MAVVFIWIFFFSLNDDDNDGDDDDDVDDPVENIFMRISLKTLSHKSNKKKKKLKINKWKNFSIKSEIIFKTYKIFIYANIIPEEYFKYLKLWTSNFEILVSSKKINILQDCYFSIPSPLKKKSPNPCLWIWSYKQWQTFNSSIIFSRFFKKITIT